MVAIARTVAYLGLEARSVEVQCQVAAGVPAFIVVGLPDKAVAESRERVRAAIAAIGLSLPPKRITVNLSPADLPKEGSHYDVPSAVALLGAMGIVDPETQYKVDRTIAHIGHVTHGFGQAANTIYVPQTLRRDPAYLMRVGVVGNAKRDVESDHFICVGPVNHL